MSSNFLRSMANLLGDILSCSSVGGIHEPTNTSNEYSATIQLFSPPNEASSGNHPSSETSDPTMSSLTDASPGQSLPEVADHVPEPDDRPVATQPQDTVPVEPSDISMSVGMGSVDDIPSLGDSFSVTFSAGSDPAEDVVHPNLFDPDLLLIRELGPSSPSPIDAAKIREVLKCIDIHIRHHPKFDSTKPRSFFTPLTSIVSSGCLNDTFIGRCYHVIDPVVSLHWLLTSRLGRAKFRLREEVVPETITVIHVGVRHLTPIHATGSLNLGGYYSCRTCPYGWESNVSRANTSQLCPKCNRARCYPFRQYRLQRFRYIFASRA